MALFDRREVARIATNPEFSAFIASIEEELTRKVMARGASPDALAANLAEYHAVQMIKSRLAAISAPLHEDNIDD